MQCISKSSLLSETLYPLMDFSLPFSSHPLAFHPYRLWQASFHFSSSMSLTLISHINKIIDNLTLCFWIITLIITALPPIYACCHKSHNFPVFIADQYILLCTHATFSLLCQSYLVTILLLSYWNLLLVCLTALVKKSRAVGNSGSETRLFSYFWS